MKRVLLVVLRCGVILAALVVGWVNLRLYLGPATEPDFDALPPRVTAHLAGIGAALENGAGEDMQGLFPEGYFFTHELYGLAWVEVGLRSREHRAQALREARRALRRIESPPGKAAFPADLPPGHGMFYAGWRNHLHAGVALLSGNETDLARLRARCDELAATMRASPAWPWMASYRQAVWPCDAPPGIHAMRVHDHLAGEGRYAAFIEAWLTAVKESLDPEFGMITHTADPGSGRPLGTPRGTSQTIILRFLADIDPVLGSRQYELFREHFHGTLLGVPVIREYPRGVGGGGDIDSGPLIVGYSVSATVVGMGVAQVYGDHALARAASQLGEAFGFPTGLARRRYLGGAVPVGDAFVVHATTARPWLRADHDFGIAARPVSPFWRVGMHLLSLLPGAGLIWTWRRIG